VKFTAEKISRKRVTVKLRLFNIPGFELFGAELKIDIKHFQRFAYLVVKWLERIFFREAVADLHGQHGLAHIGIGKKDAQLIFEPKAAEELPCGGFAELLFHPVVSGFGTQQAISEDFGPLA